MDRITVTATLRTPIAARGFMTLDGILAGILFDQLGDVDAAHDAVPIKRTGDLFHASAMFTDDAEKQPFTIAASLRQRDLDLSIIEAPRGARAHPELNANRRRDFGNIVGGNRIHATNTVTWDAEGDADKIEALLNSVSFIGAHRARGYGEIDSITIDSGDLDGLTDYDGSPMRPIPVDMFTGDTSLPTADLGWRPAYWAIENRAECYAPMELIK